MRQNDLPKHVNAARLAVQNGDTQAASRHYKAAVRLDRRNHHLLLEAGVAAAQSGDLNTARDYLIGAVKLDGKSADVYFNLGHVYLSQNSYELALRAFERALELDPEYPDIHYSLAEALFGLEQIDAANQHAKTANEKSPLDLDAWLLRARCEDRLDNPAKAEQIYRHLLQLSPNHLDGQLLLARNYSKRFMIAEAKELADKLMTTPDLPNTALLQIGQIYGGAQQSEKAMTVLKQALARDANDAATHAVLGSAYIDLGEFDLSEEHLRTALKLNPRTPLAYQSLADIKRLQDSDRANLEKLYRSKDLDSHGRMQCGFALYYLYDKAGEYDAAFNALTHANDLMREYDPQDVEANQTQLLKLRRILTSEFLSARAGQGYSGDGAVFIVGMPRSGTTLTEQILANHPKVFAGGERSDIQILRSNINNFPDGMRELDEAWARRAGKSVHDAMFAEASGETLATDKLPANYVFMGLIKWVLPKAKFIYCRRRPQPNALSIYEQHFMTLPFSRHLADIALVYKHHQAIMEHWGKDCGIDYLTVDYEELVQTPELVAERIYDYVGLDWKPDYLDVTRVDRQINTASRWQARQPINTSSVEKWRRYEKQLQPFTDALEELSISP